MQKLKFKIKKQSRRFFLKQMFSFFLVLNISSFINLKKKIFKKIVDFR